MQIISIDITVISNTVHDLTDFSLQSLATQPKKGEQLVSMMPNFRKAFDLLGDDIVNLSPKNESFKSKIGS